MSCWINRSPASSYISKLDLTLSREKVDRSQAHILESTSTNHCFGTASDISGTPSCKKNLADTCDSKPINSSGVHCSRLDITLEQKDRRKDSMKCPTCNCYYASNRLQMPWRYSSSCRDTQCSQACFKQGGFAPDHGCWYTIPNNQNSVNCQKSSSSNVKDHIRPADSPTSKSQSLWTSRLDVVLASNSSVSISHIGKPYAVYTSCNPEQPARDNKESVTQMEDPKGVKMYVSSCSLTVQPLQSKYQGNNNAQSSLLVPQMEHCSPKYTVDFQSPHKGFILTDAPTLQITQFQVTRSSVNSPRFQETSNRDIRMSPERFPRVAGSSRSPEIMPNVVVFQRNSSPAGCRTNFYPVLIPTQHKASKITVVVGSSVAPVPVRVIQEYSRSPTPAIFISNGDHPNSPEDLGSGFLLSVNPIGCSRQRYMDTPRSSPLFGTHQARCNPAEPYLCHTPSFTVMPRLSSSRDGSSPVAVSIEAFGGRRGAVKISISHSGDPNILGMSS